MLPIDARKSGQEPTGPPPATQSRVQARLLARQGSSDGFIREHIKLGESAKAVTRAADDGGLLEDIAHHHEGLTPDEARARRKELMKRFSKHDLYCLATEAIEAVAAVDRCERMETSKIIKVLRSERGKSREKHDGGTEGAGGDPRKFSFVDNVRHRFFSHGEEPRDSSLSKLRGEKNNNEDWRKYANGEKGIDSHGDDDDANDDDDDDDDSDDSDDNEENRRMSEVGSLITTSSLRAHSRSISFSVDEESNNIRDASDAPKPGMERLESIDIESEAGDDGVEARFEREAIEAEDVMHLDEALQHLTSAVQLNHAVNVIADSEVLGIDPSVGTLEDALGLVDEELVELEEVEEQLDVSDDVHSAAYDQTHQYFEEIKKNHHDELASHQQQDKKKKISHWSKEQHGLLGADGEAFQNTFLSALAPRVYSNLRMMHLQQRKNRDERDNEEEDDEEEEEGEDPEAAVGYNSDSEYDKSTAKKRRKKKKRKKKKKRRGTVYHTLAHHMDYGLLVLYQVPTVRHRFEDPQHDHDVDWADLFFDLTYVAAAYRLGTMLKADVSPRGVFHFLVLSCCMMDAWKFKTLHDSMFEATDVFHKMIDVFYVCTVGAAAIFIRPLIELEDVSQGHAFGLSLALFLNCSVLGAEKMEIFIRSPSRAAHVQTMLNMIIEVLPRWLFYAAAAVVAGNYRDANNHRKGDGDGGDGDESNQITEDRTKYGVVNWLLLSAYLGGSFLPLLLWLGKVLPDNVIPWHYKHIAHRYGEWIMLVLGESILSVILAPVENRMRYYLCFFTALLIVQMLQLVHFSSEEFDANKHALYRKLRSGRLWLFLMTAYSISLIALGVSLKAVLSYVVCDVDAYSSDYDDIESDRRMLRPGGTPITHRNLLATEYSSFYADSSGDGDGDSGNDVLYGSDGYCTFVPGRYVWLLCSAFTAQYVVLQVSIPLHEGLVDYGAHFFAYSQSAAYGIVAIKLLTVMASLGIGTAATWLARKSKDRKGLEAHVVLLSMLVIAVIQGATQALENMIVHMRRDDQYKKQQLSSSSCDGENMANEEHLEGHAAWNRHRTRSGFYSTTKNSPMRKVKEWLRRKGCCMCCGGIWWGSGEHFSADSFDKQLESQATGGDQGDDGREIEMKNNDESSCVDESGVSMSFIDSLTSQNSATTTSSISEEYHFTI